MTYENPGVAPEPVRSRRRPVILVTGIVLAVLVMAIGALVAVNNFTGQQKTESLSALKGDHLNALGDARGKVQPAANAYLAAYKKARNAPASRDQAMKDSQKEKDEFQQASNSARSALQELKSGHDSADTPVGVAVQQLVESHEDYFDYMDGLVESYPQFEGLFRDDEAARCNGLFVGSKASTLRERQTLLAQAAEPCRKAASDLLHSKNNAYVEFARTFDNKVAELQERAEVTAKGEENYTEFVRLKDDLVKRAADAEARNAPEAEVQKIADDAKAVNARIRANRSEFDFAAKRYLAGVKDMPSTVENVFAKEISADIKHFDSVIPTREQILKDTIDVELTAK